MESLGHRIYIVSALTDSQTDFQSSDTNWHSHQQHYISSSNCVSTVILGIAFHLSHSGGYVVIPHCDLNLHFPDC